MKLSDLVCVFRPFDGFRMRIHKGLLSNTTKRPTVSIRRNESRCNQRPKRLFSTLPELKPRKTVHSPDLNCRRGTSIHSLTPIWSLGHAKV